MLVARDAVAPLTTHTNIHTHMRKQSLAHMKHTHSQLQAVASHDAEDRARVLAARDAVARQCVQYRGVLPVAADINAAGDKDAVLLHAALQEVRLGGASNSHGQLCG